MKTLAFVFKLLIAAIGVAGMAAPSVLVWIAQRAGTSDAFYVIGAIRIAFGLVLVSVASASRLPRTLRMGGAVIVVAGIATALTGVAGMDRARAIIDWWLQQGGGVIRAASVLLAAIGGVVAYACAPAKAA